MQLCKKSGHKIISREKFVFFVISLEIGKPHFNLYSLSDPAFGFGCWFVSTTYIVYIKCSVLYHIKYKPVTVLSFAFESNGVHIELSSTNLFTHTYTNTHIANSHANLHTGITLMRTATKTCRRKKCRLKIHMFD